MNIYLYVGWIAWIPFLLILLFFIYKEIIIIKRYYKMKNIKQITFDNYQTLNLIKKDNVEYRLPRGQVAYFTYKDVDLSRAQQSRISMGQSIGGIKIPFSSLSLSKRKYFNKNEFVDQGKASITVTNKVIRIETESTASLVEHNIRKIQQLKFIDDERTVYFTLIQRAWPIKIKFNTKEEAKEFINGVWTIFNLKGNKFNVKSNNLNFRDKSLEYTDYMQEDNNYIYNDEGDGND